MPRSHRTVLASSLIIVALAAPASLKAVTPEDAGQLPLSVVYQNFEDDGDQFDPHVDGDIASYTSDRGIRFYNFFTGQDAQVPAETNMTDRLSDVSNGKVTFTREDDVQGTQHIFVYDTATPASPAVEVGHQSQQEFHFASAIGGNTVAFIDLALATTGGELIAAGPGGATVRVTDDLRDDQQPQVSPAGDLIVWRSCLGSAPTCEIRKATWDGAGWSVADVTANSDLDENPDTDGVVIVYDSSRGGQRDIYWQSVNGGEQRLELAGAQRNPSVRGGLVVFESNPAEDPSGPHDPSNLFAYEIATNRLYQITSMDNHYVWLSDVTALGGLRFRVVFTSGIPFERNVLGMDFELPDSDPPVIACNPAADGAWHADNVSFVCTATDAGSGLASPAQPNFSVATEVAVGDEQPDAVAPAVPVQVCDIAGNCAMAQVGGNRIDRRAPTVTVTTPSGGATYVQGQSVLANYGCVDGGSGLASCAGTVAPGQPIDTSSLGAKTFSVAATDAVGNSSVVDVPYTVAVAGPTIAGLIQQVNALSLSWAAKRLLIATLNVAQQAVNQGKLVLARAALQSFVVEVRALMLVGAIPPATGNNLISQAQAIAAAL